MMKNTSFMMLICAVLFGISFEIRSSEGNDKAACVIVGAVVGMAVVRTVKNTATYKTYSQHQDRLAEEKEMSYNSLLNAQELASKEEVIEDSMEDRVKAYERFYDEQQRKFNEKNLLRKQPKIIQHHQLIMLDDYPGKEFKK